ncbi:helix-hairpin-helix domain-containing protein [Rathayibacter soli]|uniref:helix-hairpin-helix domain-containing protein n=1 Tax=Rathayibacter soli TaxID=3144168 RepID=UPI0027E4E6B3|nr:helix-hairpin-helix domain-containing protein [Glaciibacter superstes]
MSSGDTGDLPKIGAPATRALANVGIVTLDDLRRASLGELAKLHGVGPKALRILQDALARDTK